DKDTKHNEPDQPVQEDLMLQVEAEVRPKSPVEKMPDSSTAREILRKRAVSLSSIKHGESDKGKIESYLRVRIGNEIYGILQKSTQEILYVSGISPVPCTPEFIAGVVSCHGEMIAVIDLMAFFAVGKAGKGDDSRIVVVRGGDMVTGIIVDSVEDESNLYEIDLLPPLTTAVGVNPKFVKGLHKGTTAILDMDKILSDPAILIDENVR
ncbi:MAG: purine-binding chemotaxis protein CheW, partial [Gammaproteobacteria bacterium]|nr:purine-binding chemotaxis protein CheW [Gammaproteobacteria bacterium]